MAFTPLVPTSTPRKQGSATSTHSEQDLHRQLIESLVRITLLSHSREVEGSFFDLARTGRAERRPIGRFAAARSKVTEQTLNLGVGVEARDFVLEDEIGPHAAGGEVPHALLVFGPIRVAVEVT